MLFVWAFFQNIMEVVTMILVDISGASAAIRKQDVLTAGMVGETVKFRFDDDWEGLAKTAVFRAGDVTKDAIVNDSVSKIPHEVLILGLPLEIGVYGTKDDGKVVIPTVWAKTNPVKAGADPSGDEGLDPSLPIWAEIQEEVERIKENGVGGITEEDLNAKLEGYATEDFVESSVVATVRSEFNNQKEPLIEEVTEKVLESIEIPEGGGITKEQLAEILEAYVTKEYFEEGIMGFATMEAVESVIGEAIDMAIGDIESALDELHNYAQGLINGGGA
jgi:hypothetical protein